jgi:hypothetical protein
MHVKSPTNMIHVSFRVLVGLFYQLMNVKSPIMHIKRLAHLNFQKPLYGDAE